jgi:4-amino-4-deoxy-L-arabinose transferase-like glycosyltransferase
MKKKKKPQKLKHHAHHSLAQSIKIKLSVASISIRQWLQEPELQLLLALLGIALFFRFYNFTDLGLTHFDEGIFAAHGAIWVHRPAVFIKYCCIDYAHGPPGLPLLIGFSLKLFGVNDFMTLLPSILLGSLTIPTLYLLAREVDGRQTAFWAALLLAITNFHIVYSRMALTDVPLVFFFVTGLLFGLLAFRQGRWWQFAALGLCTGLALNIKYNGFMAFLFLFPYFAIVMFYEDLLEPLALKKHRFSQVFISFWRKRWKLLVGLAAAIIIAGLSFYPWYFAIDESLGHEDVTKIHRGYAIPIDQGLKKLVGQPTWFFSYFIRWALIPFLFAPLGIVLGFWQWRKEKILILIWTIGYYCLLYFYFPYTRHAIPLVPALCILAGIALDRILRAIFLAVPLLTKYANIVKSALAIALVVFAFVHEYPMLSLDTNSYREAALTVADVAQKDTTIFTDTLRNFRYYIPNSIDILPLRRVINFLQMPGTKLFVFDIHKTWSSATPQFLRDNRQKLNLINKIPNRRYEHILTEPADMNKLEQIKRNPEKFDALLNIYIYRMNGPATIPTEWMK